MQLSVFLYDYVNISIFAITIHFVMVLSGFILYQVNEAEFPNHSFILGSRNLSCSHLKQIIKINL